VSAAAGSAPGFEPTVPELISGIQGYDTELTNQINSIISLPTDSTTQENLVTGVLSEFQNAINESVNNLPQNYTSSSEIADLEGVLSSEANMTTELTALNSDVPLNNVGGIVNDNAYIYDYAQYTYSYMQDAIGAIDIQAFLAGLGL